MNVFQKFPETIFTPKEWFLSKKGPKEGERVARGDFHERVGETPVHWLPPAPGVGPTPKPFSVFENGPFENFLRSNSIFIHKVNFMVCLSSYFIPISTMALNSSDKRWR